VTVAALAILWASVIVIPCDTFAHIHSPQWVKYQLATARSAVADEPPGRARGPGVGVGMALMPYLETGLCVFIGLLFTGGIVFLQAIGRWRADLELFFSGAFCCGCLLGAWLGVGEVLTSADWEFTTRAVGFSLSVLGLTLGAIGVGMKCLIQRRNVRTL
jgi:hypothetical protein